MTPQELFSQMREMILTQLTYSRILSKTQLKSGITSIEKRRAFDACLKDLELEGLIVQLYSEPIPARSGYSPEIYCLAIALEGQTLPPGITRFQDLINEYK